MTPQPLRGIRVIDFCWMIAGPLGTRLLADLGAEVIKIESIARLDRIREVGVQPPGVLSPETNAVFNDCNVNKRSMMLNLGHPRGIEIAKALIAKADIVTSNFTPDRMNRWGLGYDDLKAIKSDIIVASMPVMGTLGPHSHWRAVGNGVIAMGGLNGLTGFPDRAPVGLGTLHSDFTSPYFAALQIAAAVLQRNRTGAGQFIELSQYEATVHLLDTEVLDYLVNGHETQRRGNRSNRIVPHGVFPTAGDDRWIAIAVRSKDEWIALCTGLGLDALKSRTDLFEAEGRFAAEDEIERAISERTCRRDAWELADSLQRAGVPAAPVEDVCDLAGRDPMHERFLVETPHPAGHSMLLQHEPLTWNGERLPIRLAPLLGEDTAAVCEELLGLDEAAVGDLVAEGVLC